LRNLTYYKSLFGEAAARITLVILLTTFIIPLQIYGQKDSTLKVSLHIAVLVGNIDAVKQYIEDGSDLNEKDQFGSTPLIIATTFGRTEIVKALIEAGADLNIPSNDGSTPLHIAALFCHTEIIKALLDNSANRYLRNDSGSTAFDIAAAPFDVDKHIYDQLGTALGPLGLYIDYERIKKMRPDVTDMLRPGFEELKSVEYTPLPGDDWNVSAPLEQGLDSLLVAELYRDAAELETIYGLLVIKNGYLIAESYFNEGSIDQLSKRASVTKSYTSALVGIALDKGCLSSVNKKLIDFFPEVADQITDQRKKSITLREMLQMRAGYPWEETDPAYWDAIWTGDYIHLIADIPLTSDPGTEFHYSNLTSNWLGTIVARACTTDLKSFGQEYLFSPLDVELGGWTRDIDGYYIGSGDMEFTARDMAKFGLLYLNEGAYKGRQIIPADWIKESLQSYSDDINSAGVKSSRVGRYFHNIGYGYQWWSATVGEHHFNFAWGHGGQLIVLLDELDMVIVFTADSFYGKEEHSKSWKYEKAIINTVGKFIKSLPKE
jgi:CubicO group peptidase (beta-lactamase class C family)